MNQIFLRKSYSPICYIGHMENVRTAFSMARLNGSKRVKVNQTIISFIHDNIYNSTFSLRYILN
jgi:hypothetical protein